jgi:predicted secreted protein
MATKRIQISDDGGANYFTFPGSTGDMRRELASVNDTIFGQNFQSEDVSIGQFMITCNSFFKGVAGYIARVMQGGTPVVMTTEATTLVSGKTYQITNAVRRIIDYNTPLVVLDNAVDHTADVLSVDYLNGTVTFKPAYTVTGAVTLTGAYVPTVVIGKSRNFTLTQTAAEIDTTDYETAQANGGWRTFDPGLASVRMDIGGIFNSADAVQTALASRALMYVDIAPANDVNSFFRGFFKRTNFGQSGDVGALEDRTLQLGLYVPDGLLVERPFGWYFTNATTLNLAVRKALSAWQNMTKPKIRYLPDGTTGFGGDAIVTEATLANTLEGLNEFRFSFRGSGTPALVP